MVSSPPSRNMPSRHLSLFFTFSVFRIASQNRSPSTHSHKKYVILPTTAAAAFGIFAVLALFFLCWYRKFLKQRSNKTSPDDGASFKLRKFKYRHLKKATKSFSQSQKLGKGGFGMVYRGVLRNGKEVAVKKLDLASSQGEREFQNELSICGGLNSPYVVSLLGYCTHGRNIRLLVYECMQNRSLQEALFEKGYPVHLDWSKRFKIIFDTAKALEFLHLECSPPIIHGDVKPSNILLDSQFSARIADFGLARLKTEDFWADNPRMSASSEKFRSETPDRFRSEAPERFNFGTPDRLAAGMPEMMSRSSTRNAFSDFIATEAEERKKLREEKPVVIDIHPMEAPPDPEEVLSGDILLFSPPAQPIASQDENRPGDIIPDCNGEKSQERAEDSDYEQETAHPMEGRTTTDMSATGNLPQELPLPPLDRQASHKRRVAGGQTQDKSVELAGKDYVIDWIGSELDISKDEETFPVEENRAAGKAKTSNSTPSDARRKANGEIRATEASRKEKVVKSKHRKSREWWKDEYFAELSSKNGSFPKRAKSMCVDHSGDLSNQRRELKKIGHRSAKEWLTSRSKDWLRDYHSGDLSLSRGRERRSGVPSAVSDFWSGDLLNRQFSGDLLSRQWNGELASKDASSSTSMRGTVCYVPPEYGGHGILSEKGDIYSFGVLMLVILSGRRPIQVTASPMKEFEKANLITWARSLSQSGKLLELMDEALHGEYDRDQASLCITLALLCLQRVPATRPDISEVVKILLGETSAPSLPLELSPSPPQKILYRSPIRSQGPSFASKDC